MTPISEAELTQRERIRTVVLDEPVEVSRLIATEIARTRLRAAVVVSVRMAKRAVRRSVKKSLQKHRWRAQPSLREVTES